MALQSIPGGLWLPRPLLGSQFLAFATTLVLDAADEKAGFLIHAPRTGNVRKIRWRTGTVTTGATLDVRLETIDAATGFPSGTLFGTNTNASQVVASTDDNTTFLTQLTADAAVTQGDLLGVAIVNPSASPGNMVISAVRWDQPMTAGDFPQCALFTASWATVGNIAPVVALEYDDGSYAYVEWCHPVTAINSVTFANSSTPDVRGLRFKVPFPCKASRFWVYADADGDFDVKLLDSDGVTALATVSVDKDVPGAATAAGQYFRPFPADITLVKDTFYRLVIEPTSATSLTVYDVDVPTAAVMDALEGGQNWHYTSAKDPANEASWTQVLTKRPFMGVKFSAFDDGVGGGGGLVWPVSGKVVA